MENQSRFRKRRRALPAQLGPLFGLIGFSVLLCIMRNRSFATLENLQSILMESAVVATAALGMTIVIISGGIDLSVGSVIALCSVVVALLLNAGASPWLAAGGGVLVGFLCGSIIGLFVGFGGLVPFVVTLGMWGALRGAAIGLAGENTVYVNANTWLDDLLHPRLGGIGQLILILPGVWMSLVAAVVVVAVLRYTRFGRHEYAIDSNEATARLCGIHVRRIKLFIYAWAGSLIGLCCVLQFTQVSRGDSVVLPGVWISLGAAVIVAAMLRYTRFGRHVFAIGSNEATARLCGIHVRRNKLLIYALAGLFTGLAGVLQFSRVTQGDPTTANGMELDIIAAVVIGGASLSGGQGYVFGSMIGALLMTVIGNGCTKLGIHNWVQQIVTGGIIILAAGVDQFRRRRME